MGDDSKVVADGLPPPKEHPSRKGLALEVARKRKEITCPELAGESGRARLVVLATEVGGRWSSETAQFLVFLGMGPRLDTCQRSCRETLHGHGPGGGRDY